MSSRCVSSNAKANGLTYHVLIQLYQTVAVVVLLAMDFWNCRVYASFSYLLYRVLSILLTYLRDRTWPGVPWLVYDTGTKYVENF